MRLLLRSYLYQNATSSTRVHSESKTAVRHDIRQLSRGVSVTVVDPVSVGPDLPVGSLSSSADSTGARTFRYIFKEGRRNRGVGVGGSIFDLEPGGRPE